MRQIIVTIPELCALSPMVTEGNIKQQVKRSRDNAWAEWQHFKHSADKRKVCIDYATIPHEFIVKYQLPDLKSVNDAIEKVRREQKQEYEVTDVAKYNKQVVDLYNKLREEKRYAYQPYFTAIREKYPELQPNKCIEFAELQAVMEYVMKHYKGALALYYDAFNMLYPDKYANKFAFANWLNKCKTTSIQDAVVNRKSVVKVQKRISDFQYNLIRSLFMDDRKYSAVQIHEKLIEACTKVGEKPYSRKSVNNYIQALRKDIEAHAARYGADATQQQMQYATLLSALYINDQWQIDGWNLPFWVNVKGKAKRFVIFLIWDNHSRKIVGYSVGASENTPLIMKALDDAIQETGFAPYEIVSDMHSFNRTQTAEKLKHGLKMLGVTWTATLNAQGKAIAERYQQYLDALCKDYPQYLGKGITSKSRDARRNPETYKELSKPQNMLTEQQIVAIAAEVVMRYNAKPLAIHGNVSPNEKYSLSSAKNAIPVNTSQRLALINPITEYKVSRGQIVIKQGIVKHEFQLPAHLASKYNNETVQVQYEDLTEGVYLYDANTGEALGSIEPKTKIHGALANQTEEDKLRLLQLNGRKKGVINQTQTAAKTAQKRLQETNPEALELIPSYMVDKDIRKEVEESSALRNRVQDMGVMVSALPIKKTSMIGKSTSAKSPYAPKDHTIKDFDFNSFLNEE